MYEYLIMGVHVLALAACAVIAYTSWGFVFMTLWDGNFVRSPHAEPTPIREAFREWANVTLLSVFFGSASVAGLVKIGPLLWEMLG